MKQGKIFKQKMNQKVASFIYLCLNKLPLNSKLKKNIYYGDWTGKWGRIG